MAPSQLGLHCLTSHGWAKLLQAKGSPCALSAQILPQRQFLTPVLGAPPACPARGLGEGLAEEENSSNIWEVLEQLRWYQDGGIPRELFLALEEPPTAFRSPLRAVVFLRLYSSRDFASGVTEEARLSI